MKQQLNIRVSEATRSKINALTPKYGGQSDVIAVAIDRLYQQAGDTPMTRDDTYSTLQDLTGHEAGAILHQNGDIWIGNWSGVSGIPREFATGTIGLGEKLTAKRCGTPDATKKAMREHERAQSTDPSYTGFRSWQVGDVIVTINSGWN